MVSSQNSSPKARALMASRLSCRKGLISTSGGASIEDATPDATAGSGIYFGLHPSLSEPTSGVTRVAGMVAGVSVRWAEWRDAQMIRREAILSYQHSPHHLEIKLHVFVTARSQSELDRILEALTETRFVERASNAA